MVSTSLQGSKAHVHASSDLSEYRCKTLEGANDSITIMHVDMLQCRELVEKNIDRFK